MVVSNIKPLEFLDFMEIRRGDLFKGSVSLRLLVNKCSYRTLAMALNHREAVIKNVTSLIKFTYFQSSFKVIRVIFEVSLILLLALLFLAAGKSTRQERITVDS